MTSTVATLPRPSHRHARRRSLGALVLAAGLALAPPLFAEESGSGHYLPGSIASFIDHVPDVPSMVYRVDALGYSGKVDADIPIPIGGLTALNLDLDLQGLALTLVWRPEWGSLSDKLGYAMGVNVPWLDLKVDGRLTTDLGGQPIDIRRSDSDSGLGDIMLIPLMFHYKQSDALTYSARLNLYAPTGDYEAGRLANLGKNFWTASPVFSVNYLSPTNGIEAQVYAGIDFNETNDDTDYKSGNQFHIDGTLAQHLPLLGGLVGIGISGSWYKQVTGDGGSGARLGDFKAETASAGPVLSYIKPLANSQFLVEAKWLKEFEVERRFEGDTFFLKAVLLL
jgi:hypothetical protein